MVGWAALKEEMELIEKYGYKLCNIFNMDETGLFYGYAPISLLSEYFADSEM
jgi:hypothetical protein